MYDGCSCSCSRQQQHLKEPSLEHIGTSNFEAPSVTGVYNSKGAQSCFEVSGEYLPLGEMLSRKVWLGGLVVDTTSSSFPWIRRGYPKGFHQPVPSATKAACFPRTSGELVLGGTEHAERRWGLRPKVMISWSSCSVVSKIGARGSKASNKWIIFRRVLRSS